MEYRRILDQALEYFVFRTRLMRQENNPLVGFTPCLSSAAFKPTPPRGHRSPSSFTSRLILRMERFMISSVYIPYIPFGANHPFVFAGLYMQVSSFLVGERKPFEPFHPEIQAVFIFIIIKKVMAPSESIQRWEFFQTRCPDFSSSFSFWLHLEHIRHQQAEALPNRVAIWPGEASFSS